MAVEEKRTKDEEKEEEDNPILTQQNQGMAFRVPEVSFFE